MLASNVAGLGLHVSGSKVHLSASVGGAGLAFSSGVLSLDIDELDALGGIGLDQTQDFFAFSDNGTEKKISFSNLQDAVFADVSGDAAIAAGGALTIAAGAVEGSMLNDDCISGQDAITSGLADTDELLVSDNGVLKRADLSVLKGYFDSFAVQDCDDANADLVVGLNFSSNAISQNRTWTLPDTSGLDVGDKIVIKAPLVSSGVLTIAAQGSDKIDRVQTQVLLEEDDASITLIVSKSGHYVVV